VAERVVLLHGIWNHRPVLWPLAARLRLAGFEVETFGYPSVLGGAEAAAQQLSAKLRLDARQRKVPAHLVGHSLGGLVSLLAAQDPELPVQRIVCLGSPLTGSGAARAVHRRGLAFGMGRSARLLLKGLEHAPPYREVGAIAGTLEVGLGRVFGTFDGPHDGTVAVAETRLPGLVDHFEVRASHMGLLVSRVAARAVASFLRTGRFAG
jgi:pimeloyl-ACP methyl ester carboxylesterase